MDNGDMDKEEAPVDCGVSGVAGGRRLGMGDVFTGVLRSTSVCVW